MKNERKVNKSNKSVKKFPLELLLFYDKKKKSFWLTNNFSHTKLTFANEEFFFFFFFENKFLSKQNTTWKVFLWKNMPILNQTLLSYIPWYIDTNSKGKHQQQ